MEDSARVGRADCSASVSTAAAAASARDCVMNVRKIDVHLDRSAVAHHGAICCDADWSAAAAVTTVAVRGFFEASTSTARAAAVLGGAAAATATAAAAAAAGGDADADAAGASSSSNSESSASSSSSSSSFRLPFAVEADSMRARRVTSQRPKRIIMTAVATSMSVTAELRTSRRRRVSDSIYSTKTHAAHTLTPLRLWISVSQMERTLSASCGAYCRSSPSESSRCANPCIVSKNEAEHSRVGSACGSRRAVDVIMKTSGDVPVPGADGFRRSAGFRPVVAAGSFTSMPNF